MSIPVTRLQPFYSGQFGVQGSDVSRGLRTSPAGVVFYVDANHPNATATADGTDPENPLTTIAAAFARLVTFHALGSVQAEGSVIVVAPGTYTDNITIDRTSYPADCTLLAAANSKFDVVWVPASGDALTIDQSGWVVDGFHFQPAADGSGVHLTWTAGAGAEDTYIQNCFFDGRWATGLFNIELDGAPANVTIQNCRFAEFGVGDPCITVASTATADPYQCHILGNTFQECGEYITSDVAGGWSQTIIAGNLFCAATADAAYPAGAGGTLIYIDLAGATNGYNTIYGNICPGDYSIAGGYIPGTNDTWIGNYASDVAEAEIGDNGITILPPA